MIFFNSTIHFFDNPQANEKKDKKTKRAEEKKRAREREAKKAASAANEYIPGMEGSVRPADEVVNDEIEEEFQQRNYVSFSQFAKDFEQN